MRAVGVDAQRPFPVHGPGNVAPRLPAIGRAEEVAVPGAQVHCHRIGGMEYQVIHQCVSETGRHGDPRLAIVL